MNRKYIGVDVGDTSVMLGIVDDKGQVHLRKEAVYTEAGSTAPVMDVIIGSIRELADASIGIEAFSGIGVSAAGCINSVEGKVAINGGNVPNWSHTEVCSILRKEFDIPVTLANDANCAILGEFWTGAAKGYTDVLGITLGTGVGGGVITGGRLLEGSHGFAGELGHFPTHAGGDHCICGLDGCFERYASTSSMIRSAIDIDPEFRNGKALFSAAAAGEMHAKSILDNRITEIAYGIAGFVHVFDPQLVLIGGGVSAQKEMLVKPLGEKVLSMIMPDFAADLEFKAAALGNDAGMVGAVYYLLSKEELTGNM